MSATHAVIDQNKIMLLEHEIDKLRAENDRLQTLERDHIGAHRVSMASIRLVEADNDRLQADYNKLDDNYTVLLAERDGLRAKIEQLTAALWEIVHHCDQRQEGGADKDAQWAADRAAAALAGKEGKMSPLTPEQLKRFDEASDHPYECKCDICKEWWSLVPPARRGR